MVVEIKIKSDGKVYTANIVYPDPDFEPMFYLSRMAECLSAVRGSFFLERVDDNDICVGGNLYEYLHSSASAVGTRGNEQGEDK